jgi:hypothetical protein
LSFWQTRLRETVEGIRDGIAYGLIYCVLGVILYLIRGSGPTDGLGISLMGQLMWYMVAGVTGGGISGLLRPFTGSRPGLLFVGFIAALPAGITVMRMLIPHDPRWLLIGIGFALVIGPPAALVLKDDD